jgi:putative endopeptidase
MTHRPFSWILAIYAAAVLTAAALPADRPTSTDVVASHLDTTVSPAVDFFDYANGGWLKENPIPATESRWGIGNLVRDEIYERLRTISEAAGKAEAAAGTEERKIGDFWGAAMDEALAEKAGLSPLRPELDRIRAIRDPRGVIDAAFAELPLRIGPFFSLYVGQDAKASDVIAVQLYQGGLGLPDRDYYFNTDENSVRVRGEYVKHVQKMLTLVAEGAPVRESAGQGVMDFETALARASRKIEDLRDPERNYNKMETAAVTRTLTPSIDWPSRLKAEGLGGASTVIVGQPEFFSALETQLAAAPIEDLKDYLTFHLVSDYAPFLTSELARESFAFYQRVLNGQPEERPRWKRALDAEEDALGMVLGKLFVKEYFPEQEKTRYSDMVEAIRGAYRERIRRLDWMSDATKAKALEKLERITRKVGYPDKWKDYSALEIGRQSWAENMMNAARWRFQDDVKKFGKPVDRAEWDMTPQTYNAYYNPSNNEIVLPAAIFTVPGVPDAQVDDAVAYGYVGASTIGHEITHGFDDEGRQFDADGNLKSWWTEEDERKFNERAAVMVKQFDAYEPLPGMHINGKATLGENIADLGGILLGFDAFQRTAQYSDGARIAGLTPTQRYFLGYALGWMTQARKETLARQLVSDVHSPAKWRVNGPFSDVPAFYEAFGVKEGDPMWRAPADRVSIW